MTDLKFQNRLQFYGSNLSKSERRIAEFIQVNPREAAVLSSMDLAKSVDTSNSTVTRFCQKLNYRNYIELQTLLLNELSPQPIPAAIVEKINFYYQKVLNSSVELVNSAALQQFAEQIERAESVLIVGLGSSGLMAAELNLRLVQMGIQATAITDSHLMFVQTNLFLPTGLIIAISSSGETREVVHACQAAKTAGMTICLMTQNNHTRLTALSDTILFTGDICQTNDDKFVNSQLPVLFLIDTLTYRLLENPKYKENHCRTLQALAAR